VTRLAITPDSGGTARPEGVVTPATRRSAGKRELPAVSVIIASHTGRQHLQRCLPALLADDYPDFQVIVVDNASTDGTAEFVEQEYPSVKVIRNALNLGFSRASNMGAAHAPGEYLAFLNQDAVVRPGWLASLVVALEGHPKAALATPQILVLAQPHSINACGNQSHYTGLSFCRGAGQPAGSFTQLEQVNAVSGAAFVMRKDVFEQLGGFDEDFFMYMEDIDLSWRARLAGYSSLYVPDATVYHDYALTFGPKKTYYQERNRWLMLLKILRWKSIALLLPALLLSEFITWGWIVLRDAKNISNKAKAYGWIVRNWRVVAESRRQAQTQRRVTDKELIGECVSTLAYEQLARGRIAKAAQMAFDPLLTLLHLGSLRVMRW
jgi:GT2 family glycosyltransferase